MEFDARVLMEIVFPGQIFSEGGVLSVLWREIGIFIRVANGSRNLNRSYALVDWIGRPRSLAGRLLQKKLTDESVTGPPAWTTCNED